MSRAFAKKEKKYLLPSPINQYLHVAFELVFLYLTVTFNYYESVMPLSSRLLILLIE